jgi:hypothetical protein
MGNDTRDHLYNRIDQCLFSENGIRITNLTLKWARVYIKHYKTQLNLSRPTIFAENCKICEYLQNVCLLQNTSVFDSFVFPRLSNLGQTLPLNISSMILIAAKLCEIHDIFENTNDIINYLEPIHLIHHFFWSSCSENNFIHNTLVSIINDIINLFQFRKTIGKSETDIFPLPNSVLNSVSQKWAYLNKKKKCNGSHCVYQSRDFVNVFSDANTLDLLQNKQFKSIDFQESQNSENRCVLRLLDNNHLLKKIEMEKLQTQICGLRSNILYETKLLSELNRLIDNDDAS